MDILLEQNVEILLDVTIFTSDWLRPLESDPSCFHQWRHQVSTHLRRIISTPSEKVSLTSLLLLCIKSEPRAACKDSPNDEY